MKVNYQAGKVKAEGEWLVPKGKGPFPSLLLLPYFRGADQIPIDYANKIVKAYGWAVFVADYYGDGKIATSDQEASALLAPLKDDPKEIRERMKAAFETLQSLPEADGSKLGAIGFCFGGLGAIELFKMGLSSLKGAAAFHALLKSSPIAKNIQGSLLVMNGYKDPLVTLEERIAFEKEMDEANIDWQYHIYGKASHAFTNYAANNPKFGLIYDPSAEKRSFELMGNFFSALFD